MAEQKYSYKVLLFIITVLTIAIVVLAGYLFLVSDKLQGSPAGTVVKENISPEEDELASRLLFEEKKLFNLKSSNGNISVIQLNVELKYFKKVRGMKDIEEKLNFYDGKIKEVIGEYLQGLSLEDVKNVTTRQKTKEYFKKEINKILNSSEAGEWNIIYDVLLIDWFYQ